MGNIPTNDSLSPRGNAKYISKLNKAKVISLIRGRERLSRAEIAKKSGLSAPTVSRIVVGLIEENLVTETDPRCH
jgi:N-acetylglucosamine repressor